MRAAADRSDKKPNPGPKAPRVGGRAKWPSHSGRDQDLRRTLSLLRASGDDRFIAIGNRIRHPVPLDAKPAERVAGYQRFTRPSRDVVIVSVCDPRRSTTRVFDAPHPMPVGPNTTSGLDTSSVTPCVIGPGQRW